MPGLQLLKREEQKSFDRPPVFSSSERKQYIRLTETTKNILQSLRGDNTKLHFFVTLAYFKANKRFYARQFHATDLHYAARQLAIPEASIAKFVYDKDSFSRHRRIILEHLGFEPYTKAAQAKILPELHTMIRSQNRPKLIFEHVVDSLIRHRIEVPTYFRLHRLVSKEMQKHKAQLLAIAKNNVSKEEKQLLDGLLEQVDVEGKLIPHYTTTLLKRFSQSVRPKKIAENVRDVKRLGEHYHDLESTLDALALPHEGLRYYAQSVLNAKVFQVARRSQEDRYLHLIAFVAHQFYRGQDVLVDTLLKTTQTALNAVDREHKDSVFEHRKAVQTLGQTPGDNGAKGHALTPRFH